MNILASIKSPLSTDLQEIPLPAVNTFPQPRRRRRDSPQRRSLNQPSTAAEVSPHVAYPHEIETQMRYVAIFLYVYAARENTIGDRSIKTFRTVESKASNIWKVLKSNRPKEAEALSRGVYLSGVTKIMQALSDEGKVTHKLREKNFLERDDLFYLIARDTEQAMARGDDIQKTFRQHLVWCFGLITGVRPSSLMLASDLDRDPITNVASIQNISPLTWGDIRITRDTEDSQSFIVPLSFRRPKGHIHKART